MGYLLDVQRLKKEDRIILCGAGAVGKDFYKQLVEQKYQVQLWIADKYDGILVKSKEEVRSVDYDIIILATAKVYIATEMRAELIEMGVPNEKIRWIEPVENKYGFIYDSPFLKEVYEWRLSVFTQKMQPIELLEKEMQLLREAYTQIQKEGNVESRKWFADEEKGVAYLHNAKVACTSIEASLKKIPEQKNYVKVHQMASMSLIKQDTMDEYYKFTFVRNPFARLVSCYKSKYIADKKVFGCSPEELCYGRKHYLLGWLQDVKDFREFVIKVCRIPEEWQERHFKSQYNLIYDKNKPVVDFIGKFEYLDEQFTEIAEKYNLLPLLRYNETTKDDWKAYYTKDIAEMVYEKYIKDIETFGYKEESLRFLEEFR